MDVERIRLLGERVGKVIFDASMARQQGRLADAAELHGEAVTLFSALERWSQARDQASQALALYEQVGDEQKAARTRYALGVIEAQSGIGDGGGRLAAQLRASKAAEDHAMVARLAEKLAGIALRSRRYAEAGRFVEDMANAKASQGDLPGVIEALRLRGFLFQVQGRPYDAFLCLDRAAKIARQGGEESRLLELRLDLHMMAQNPIVGDLLGDDSLERILDDAEAAGRPGLGGYARLSRASAAMQEGRLEDAAGAAQNAREAALEATDALLYLMACLMLAEVREKLGDRTGVLTVLFTCQATLGDLLGDEGRLPVLQVIDSLESRWGKDVFDAHMTAYRSQFTVEGGGALDGGAS